MSTAQLAAVSFLARHSGRTHALCSCQLQAMVRLVRIPGLNPRIGVLRVHVELYIRHLGECKLIDSSVVTRIHGVRGFFRFAHIDGLISADPAVYASAAVPGHPLPDPTERGQARWTQRWKPALNAFFITFADRFPVANSTEPRMPDTPKSLPSLWMATSA